MNQPLSGLRVVELATGVAGPYAAKLLGDFGADVVKVEPPGGDPVRYAGPFPAEAPGAGAAASPGEEGGLHLHLNTNKRSVVADLEDPEGHQLVGRLIDRADVLVESHPPGALDRIGLAHDELIRRQPRLVRLSVTPFGQWGPYADARGEEIVAYAMGGPMHATGLPEREPLKLAGNLVQYQCGTVAALAGLAALRIAEGQGRAVWVDVSNFETQAASIDRRTAYLMWRVMTGGTVPREGGQRLGLIPAGIFPTADGYVQVLAAPNWMPRFAAMLGDVEVTRRIARPDWADDSELPELLDMAIHLWTLARTKQEAMTEAQALGLGVTALNDPLDVLADPHFRARRFWQPVEHPVAGRYETPGAPVCLADGWRLRRPAPTLDQHGEELRAELAAEPEAELAAKPEPEPQLAAKPEAELAAGPEPEAEPDLDPGPGPARRQAPAAAPPTTRPELPLRGVRVLDLTVVWAGPYVTMLLGDLGAEVIRLDNPNLFPTATRGAIPRPRPGRAADLGVIWGAFPDLHPGTRPWNRVGPFVVHARCKLGATLDLRTELGRETFLRLVERSDVLVENNSAKVLDQLGVGWDVLTARNPRLILLRMPSLGLHGPYAGYIGFGAHVEALCGLTSLRGYADQDLSANGPTYHMDPASGAIGAFAVLAALRRRHQTGRGELIELAQAENLLNQVGEHLVEASRTGRTRRHAGNRHPVRAPQGCYPCQGDDRWVTISVGSDEEWLGLRKVLGCPSWADDPALDTAAGRRAGHDAVDRQLAAWTAERSKWEVFDRCRAEGVPAGPVLDEAELLADPHLEARGFFRENGSEDLGRFRFPGHLWHWDGPELAWGPVNRMGGDNEYVYREVAGLDDAEWAALEAEGHLSLDYVDAEGRPL